MLILSSICFAVLQLLFLVVQVKPFYNNYNKHILKKLLIFGLIFFILIFAFFYLHNNFVRISILFYKLFTLFCECIVFIGSVLIIKHHLKSHFFMFGISLNIFLLTTSISSFIANEIHEKDILEGLFQTSLVSIIFGIIFIIIFDKYLAKTIKSLILLHNKRIWDNIYIIPFALFLVGFLCNDLTDFTNDLKVLCLKVLSTTIAILTCSFFSNDYWESISRITDLEDIVIDLNIGYFIVYADKKNHSIEMKGGDSMLNVLGFPRGEDYKTYYKKWFYNIEREYIETIRLFRKQLLTTGKASVIYVWNNPKLGQRVIRTSAICHTDNNGCFIIKGSHEDITNVECVEKTSDSELMIKAMNEMYYCNYYINILNDTFISTRDQTDVRNLVGITGKASYSMNLFIDKKIVSNSQEEMRKFTNFNDLELRLKDKKSIECEYLSIAKGWCRARFLPVKKDIKGNITHVLFLVTSIDENKKKEIEAKKILEEAFNDSIKANNAKTNFLSRISHDIRTPMNVVLGMTSIAKENIDDKDKVEDCLNKIKSSGEYLLQLINKVLDMNKIESGSLDNFSYNFKLDELLQIIYLITSVKSNEKKQCLVFDTSNVKNNLLYGDNIHIQQILLNIIDNAIKYTNENGHITLKVEEKFITSNNVHKFIFTIIDDGIGMSKEYLNHIYEPFSREDGERISQIQGTGLGMSIVKKYVQFLDGDIDVESEKGKGSKFTISLPIKIVGNDETEIIEKDNDKIDYSKLNVLVVDDNELNREIICEFLKIIGTKFDVASNGYEAIDKLKTHLDYYYDIIFMDVRMPKLSGIEATKKIRMINNKYYKNIPIIALTANAFTSDIKETYDAGMNEHITKPVDLDKIKGAINRQKNINS